MACWLSFISGTIVCVQFTLSSVFVILIFGSLPLSLHEASAKPKNPYRICAAHLWLSPSQVIFLLGEISKSSLINGAFRCRIFTISVSLVSSVANNLSYASCAVSDLDADSSFMGCACSSLHPVSGSSAIILRNVRMKFMVKFLSQQYLFVGCRGVISKMILGKRMGGNP